MSVSDLENKYLNLKSQIDDFHPSIESLPFNLLQATTNTINKSTLSLLSKTIKETIDKETNINLTEKLGKISLDDLFSTDKDIVINDKLSNKEIQLLANKFVMHIMYSTTISTNYILYLNKTILFSIAELKEALLNPNKILYLTNNKKVTTEYDSSSVLNINTENDDYFNFQLRFIFSCIYIMKINKEITLQLVNSPPLYLDKINFNIFTKSFNTIIKVLEQNLQLTTIDICHDEENNNILIEIAEALKKNITLKTLWIYNKIDNIGAIALVDALKQNKTLLKLMIKSDQFNSTFDRAIFAPFVANSRVEYI
jgi:hypothetical protein